MADSTTAATATSPTPPTDVGIPPVIGRLERGEKMPTCLILVGMAGAGKTTLLTALQEHLTFQERKPQPGQLDSNSKHETANTKNGKVDAKISAEKSDDDDSNDDSDEFYNDSACYVVNLDPATLTLPYEVSIDIRDTVDYKQVMQQHRLGPNGAIMTSLNLLCTKFDQVMQILERRAYPETNATTNDTTAASAAESTTEQQESQPSPPDYILVDTPGQIEAFTWSASGTIIGESLASAFPTVLVFVVDTPRCAASPNTFMSNMLYACSMLYRARLPLVICFTKTDVASHEFCLEWMRDYEAFQEALDNSANNNGGTGFYGSLTRSLALVLDEFYSTFSHAAGVSAVTGDGLDDFLKTVDEAASVDFKLDYVQDLQDRMEEQKARKQAVAEASVARLQRDLDQDNL